MKVQLERSNKNGRREITMFASDSTDDPETLDAWIKTIQLAKRWLLDGRRRSPQVSEETDRG